MSASSPVTPDASAGAQLDVSEGRRDGAGAEVPGRRRVVGRVGLYYRPRPRESPRAPLGRQGSQAKELGAGRSRSDGQHRLGAGDTAVPAPARGSGVHRRRGRLVQRRGRRVRVDRGAVGLREVHPPRPRGGPRPRHRRSHHPGRPAGQRRQPSAGLRLPARRPLSLEDRRPERGPSSPVPRDRCGIGRPRVAEWIARIGLTGFERYHPHQLSGACASAWRWP